VFIRSVAAICVILFFTSPNLSAQNFDFNDNCRVAYNEALALKLETSGLLLKAEKQKNRNNLIPVYLENYIDFLSIYTSETKSLYEQLKKNKDERLSLLEKGDAHSPYCLFTQAEVNLQWAALSIKFGEYLTAVFEIRKAYKLLIQNQKSFPDFKPNQKSLGVLYALLGSVPEKYKWGLNLLGMEGNINNGMKYLADLINYAKTNDFIYRDETVIYDAFLILNLQGDGDAAWQVLYDNGFPKPDNLMSIYVCAQVGVHGNKNDAALEILNTPFAKDSFAAFPLIDYLHGLALLNKLDSNAASYFKKYVVEFKGENHIRSSFQKIAWCYLLQNDTANYYHFIQKAQNLGGMTIDADKQARKEAESNSLPNQKLLKARLLFDGGYYKACVAELKFNAAANLKSTEEQTEYLYRLGRVYNELGKTDSALTYYSKAIEAGKNLPRYFAANSAFESGKIYEKQGDKEKAMYYYNLCMSFPNHDYKDGLDQKAKAGLNRIK
jgi:tetratricopeptide (TPR) repeat protein